MSIEDFEEQLKSMEVDEIWSYPDRMEGASIDNLLECYKAKPIINNLIGEYLNWQRLLIVNKEPFLAKGSLYLGTIQFKKMATEEQLSTMIENEITLN